MAVPVVIGGFLNRVPIIAHESDMTPGLANRLSLPYCTKICVTFPECLKNIKKEKAVLTGTPIRKELFKGDKNAAERICGFENKKPILLIVGGSLGSTYINETIRKNIDKLLLKYNIIHICGKNNLDKTLLAKKGYKQFEYVSGELPHLLAYADFVVSRAGANLIFELLALKKPNILIPLSAKSSRGDQILNAKSFEKRGYSIVIEEENLNGSILLQKLEELDINKNNYINNMMHSELRDSTDIIVKLIVELSNKKNR